MASRTMAVQVLLVIYYNETFNKYKRACTVSNGDICLYFKIIFNAQRMVPISEQQNIINLSFLDIGKWQFHMHREVCYWFKTFARQLDATFCGTT